MNPIRRYTEADIARCSEIAVACMAAVTGVNEAARAYLISRLQPEMMHRHLMEFYSVVYEEDGVVLGVGSIYEDYIKRMYTDPAEQGKGVGSALLAHLEAHAKTQGFTKLFSGRAAPCSSCGRSPAAPRPTTCRSGRSAAWAAASRTTARIS